MKNNIPWFFTNWNYNHDPLQITNGCGDFCNRGWMASTLLSSLPMRYHDPLHCILFLLVEYGGLILLTNRYIYIHTHICISSFLHDSYKSVKSAQRVTMSPCDSLTTIFLHYYAQRSPDRAPYILATLHSATNPAEL